MMRSSLQRCIASVAAGALTGCDARIGNPSALWLLWLIPLVALFYVFSFRRRARLLARFAATPLLERLTRSVSRRRQWLKAVLVTVALIALIGSIAEPKYGFTWEEMERKGVDVIVAIDVSDSMLVRDADTGGGLTRLERAKREITDLLRILEGDRVGLVAFAGVAFVQCPLTLDYGAAEMFLDAIDTDLIPVKGTDLSAALEVSLEALAGGARESLAVILITDGEDHSGRALEVAETARDEGVRIFPIGIGRDQGSPIPAAGGGFRRTRTGEIVLSRLDEPTLQKMALASGGRYVRSVSGDVDLEQIYSEGIKAVLEDQELVSERRQRWEERFQWLLAIALPLLMIEPLVSERKRSRA
ncbi:MAG: VWA domain-containing protein [Acidobacteriota bacterium]|nr:VWA domain-containing protein [Acidobacteriota bacterium]